MFPVGNILNRGHIYFQDFWKCSSILNKAKQLQFNRKQKLKQKKRRKKPTWALPGSAQPTGSASHPLPRARRQGRMLAARWPRAGHALRILLARGGRRLAAPAGWAEPGGWASTGKAQVGFLLFFFDFVSIFYLTATV